MKLYDHKNNDAKWQKKWEEEQIYKTSVKPDGKKSYILDMFPYPSGEGLHVGHPKGYIATDIYSRFKRMNGFDVLHPMGWDAFGLPAEQYAIKNKIHPKVAVEKNVAMFKQQLSHLGLSYDWSREIDTTDPNFYKWTQWCFIKMFGKGLAYESYEPINWCPKCKTGLANEDLEGDTCERCDTVVEKKPIRQWVLKITDYADRLLQDLDTLDWPEGVKLAQKNWIGRSEGAEFDFKVVDGPVESVRIFTTRADTLFGATYVAISAELAQSWLCMNFKMDEDVKKYVLVTLEEQKKETDYSVIKEKTGIFSGVYAINPANQEKIPVWIANYVLGGVGTGAIMAVPAHDERDYEFAKKYNLPIKQVIFQNDGVFRDSIDVKANIEEGILSNSEEFNDLTSVDAKTKIIEKFGGGKVVKYKIQDWVFARQRYWGEPFPIVRDKDGKVYAVDESELPVLLPDVESYEPTDTGESPLAIISDWVNVCGYINERGSFMNVKSIIKETKEFYGEGESSVRSNQSIESREVVDVIIRDKDNNFYFLQDSFLGNKFVGGGIEQGETEIEALKREVIEETGFTNFTITKRSTLNIIWTGFHELKGKNFRCEGGCYEVILQDTARIQSEVEMNKHSLFIVPLAKLKDVVFWNNHALFIQEYLQNKFIDIQ